MRRRDQAWALSFSHPKVKKFCYYEKNMAYDNIIVGKELKHRFEICDAGIDLWA